MSQIDNAQKIPSWKKTSILFMEKSKKKTYDSDLDESASSFEA